MTSIPANSAVSNNSKIEADWNYDKIKSTLKKSRIIEITSIALQIIGIIGVGVGLCMMMPGAFFTVGVGITVASIIVWIAGKILSNWGNPSKYGLKDETVVQERVNQLTKAIEKHSSSNPLEINRSIIHANSISGHRFVDVVKSEVNQPAVLKIHDQMLTESRDIIMLKNEQRAALIKKAYDHNVTLEFSSFSFKDNKVLNEDGIKNFLYPPKSLNNVEIRTYDTFPEIIDLSNQIIIHGLNQPEIDINRINRQIESLYQGFKSVKGIMAPHLHLEKRGNDEIVVVIREHHNELISMVKEKKQNLIPLISGLENTKHGNKISKFEIIATRNSVFELNDEKELNHCQIKYCCKRSDGLPPSDKMLEILSLFSQEHGNRISFVEGSLNDMWKS